MRMSAYTFVDKQQGRPILTSQSCELVHHIAAPDTAFSISQTYAKAFRLRARARHRRPENSWNAGSKSGIYRAALSPLFLPSWEYEGPLPGASGSPQRMTAWSIHQPVFIASNPTGVLVACTHTSPTNLQLGFTDGRPHASHVSCRHPGSNNNIFHNPMSNTGALTPQTWCSRDDPRGRT